MEQKIVLPFSYFLDEDPNGNLALSTFNKKIDDACKFFESGAVIELGNGVKCSTREELVSALSKAKIDYEKKKKSTSIKGIAIFGIAVFIIAAIVIFFTQINSSNSRKDEVVYYPSGYTVLKMALENGDVRLRMTYDEISDIIGGADNISKSNGKVKYAHYYQSEREAGGYTSKHIQLCFDENGYLYKINEN